MLSKLTRGNQITIPKSIVERIGLKGGSNYLDVEYVDGVICLRPVEIEERIPNEVWEKFKEKATKKEEGDIDFTPDEAKGFLEKRSIGI